MVSYDTEDLLFVKQQKNKCFFGGTLTTSHLGPEKSNAGRLANSAT